MNSKNNSDWLDTFVANILNKEFKCSERLPCHIITSIQILAVSARNFLKDKLLLRSSALSFTTILSLVPLLAIAFAILKGFGVQNRVEPFIIKQLSGGSQEIVSYIITYINNTNMKSLGAFGLIILFITVISLLENVETTFNRIWRVKETRSLQRKFSDYLSVVISAPILIFTAVSMTSFIQSQSFVRWLIQTSYLGYIFLVLFKMIPYLVIWITMVFLYSFMPNTKINLKSAIVGGILAGTCWQIAQWGYIHFQIGVAKYNAIYGTIAVIPIFMVWIYTSWIIVLFGMEVVHSHQNINRFRWQLSDEPISIRMQEFLGLTIMKEATASFEEGKEPFNIPMLSEKLNVPETILINIANDLYNAGFLTIIATDPPYYQPAKAPDKITVFSVLTAIRNFKQRDLNCIVGNQEAIEKLFTTIDSATENVLQNLTLHDLALQPN